jgi:hypothetical protein
MRSIYKIKIIFILCKINIKNLNFIKKYSHYIPLLFFAVIDISLNCIECFGKTDIPNWKDVVMQLCLALSFVYTLTKEAKRFQNKGKYGTVYRLMFATGFLCCAFIFLLCGIVAFFNC